MCGKKLKVPDNKAGKPITCPNCDEMSVVPLAVAAADAPPPAEAEEPAGVFASMGRGPRYAASALAFVAIACLVVATLQLLLPGGVGVGDAGARWALLASACSFLLLGVAVHGRATGCPACGKWWSRAKVGSEFLDRETIGGGGGLRARSVYRTTYVCGACKHRWSANEAEEFQVAPQRFRP
jgi:hypothetical protein